MKILAFALSAMVALLALPASAQITSNLPIVCNPAGSSCTQATPVTNPDGTSIGGGVVTGTVGVKGADGTTISGPTNGVSVAQAALLASGKTAVTGTFTATGQSAAFTPIAGRTMNVTISSGVAVCQVERSFDSGSTWFVEISDAIRTAIPESFTVNEAEVGTQVRVNCTGYTSGTVTYRLSM